MPIYPGPGAIIENVDNKSLYYTYLQYHKASKLAEKLQKTLETGQKLDGEAVIIALGKGEMELLSTTFNKKASIRFVNAGDR